MTAPIPMSILNATSRSKTDIQIDTPAYTLIAKSVLNSSLHRSARSPNVTQSLPNVRSSCARCSRSIVKFEVSPASESTHDVCRICQSETGAMLQPCSCDGSVGKIHENCLNQWYAHSGRDHCEICLTQYARTDRSLKPLREWTKPKFGRTIFYKISAILCVFVILLITARKYNQRRFAPDKANSHEFGRIFIVIMSIGIFITLLVTMINDGASYVRKQYVVRFTEHENHQSKEKNCSVQVV